MEEDKRVTRVEAAQAAGVHVRTISRWSEQGLIEVQWNGWREPATYSLREVLRAAVMTDVPLPEGGLPEAE